MCERVKPCLEVIIFEYSLKLKIKRIDWLLADTCHVSASSQSLRFILSLKMNSSFITSRPVLYDRFTRLTLFIMMVLPMHVERINMELPMLHFKGLQHSVWVGTVCQNTCLQVSRIKKINKYKAIHHHLHARTAPTAMYELAWLLVHVSDKCDSISRNASNNLSSSVSCICMSVSRSCILL